MTGLRRLAVLATLAAALSTRDATAHPATAFPSVLGRWTLDPLVIPGLTFLALAYVAGVRNLWRRAGTGAGIRRGEAVAFALGLGTVVVALLSPVDYLSDLLFSAHMSQHELLMVVAAPLVVIGRPMVAGVWALPRRMRPSVVRWARSPDARAAWRFLTMPLFVLALHAAVRWVWHIPRLFEAAMRNESLHALQHASFFATAALFWWTIVHGRYGKAGYGLGFLFVFATAVHTTVLGALIATAPAVVYPVYLVRAASAGVDPRVDQALAGFVMWIPSGFLLALGGLALFAVWLAESARRAEREHGKTGVRAVKT